MTQLHSVLDWLAEQNIVGTPGLALADLTIITAMFPAEALPTVAQERIIKLSEEQNRRWHYDLECKALWAAFTTDDGVTFRLVASLNDRDSALIEAVNHFENRLRDVRVVN